MSIGVNFSPNAKKLQADFFTHNESHLCKSLRMAKDFGIYEGFGKRFQIALIKAGYTKSKYKALTHTLCKLFDVSSATVNDWYWGRKLPSMDSAIMIAITLNVCVEWLLTGRGPETPPTEPDGNGEREESLSLADLTPEDKSQLEKTLNALKDALAPKKNRVIKN